MKFIHFFSLLALACTLLLAGCNNPAQPTPRAQDKGKPTDQQASKGDPKSGDPEDAKIKANLAKLGDEERFAAAQGFCAVHTDHRLGTMGVPYKVKIKDDEVYLCCKDCEKDALKDPTKTLANAQEATVRTSLADLSPEERKAVQAQKFCAVDNENLLGAMGKPCKVMVDGQPVYLCCKGCEKTALKDPKATLAKVKELKENSSKPEPKKE